MNKEIIRKELIGKRVEVGRIKGKIIDETQNLLIIKDNRKKIKKIIKKGSKFTIYIKENRYEIKGEEINFRPEERIRLW